jgi:predicted nucleic acid-binding protein
LKVKRKLVVSDAGPLIQLATAHHLRILPRLYNVVIPEEVFEETQYYSDLPDAMEIAKATRSWL